MNRKSKGYFISYAFALLMVGVAVFLRISITSFTGPGLATYITFYPFIMFAAIFGGLGPGLVATAVSILAVDYWFLLSGGWFVASLSPVDAVGQVLFLIMGVLISFVVWFYRRNHEKQIEKLRLANIYNRSLLEASLDPLVTISREGKITDANEAAAKIRGIAREKLIGTDFSNYFTEPEKAREGYQQVFTKGSVSNYLLTIKRKDGKLTSVLYNATVYKDDKGNVLGVFAAARDVTEMDNLTKRLKESYADLEEKVYKRTQDLENANKASQNVLGDLIDEKLKVEIASVKERALLQSIGDGVVATNEDGVIILMNHAAEVMLGWKAEELIGKSLIEAWKVLDEKGNQISETERPITRALSGVITTTTTTTMGPSYFYTRKDGTKFPVSLNVTPVVAGNKIIGAIDVFRDITKEKETDKAKTEFVSLASHQLRTPLTTISWYAEMILKGDVGKVIPNQKKYLEEIYHGNQRMIELVNTLLDVSRLELGTFKVELKPTDIIALAKSVLDEQRPKINEKRLIVMEDFGKDISTFLTDPKLLRIVFQNLLANSVKYTPSGGKIDLTISSDKEKREIQISISDTGYGIPQNQQSQIFTKLFRADNVKDKDTDGTGLGLYIVKSIVENFSGKIWFKSEENKGTTFYVTLPV